MEPYRNVFLILRRTATGWGLDSINTPDAAEVRRIFGTTLLPLPLTPACSLEEALEFALQTPAGLEFGVVADRRNR